MNTDIKWFVPVRGIFLLWRFGSSIFLFSVLINFIPGDFDLFFYRIDTRNFLFTTFCGSFPFSCPSLGLQEGLSF